MKLLDSQQQQQLDHHRQWAKTAEKLRKKAAEEPRAAEMESERLSVREKRYGGIPVSIVCRNPVIIGFSELLHSLHFFPPGP